MYSCLIERLTISTKKLEDINSLISNPDMQVMTETSCRIGGRVYFGGSQGEFLFKMVLLLSFYPYAAPGRTKLIHISSLTLKPASG